MGQISSPISMRLSKSMHWPTLWNDKINYNKKVSADIFSSMVLPLLFNETIYLNKYTNNLNLTFYLNSMLEKSSTIQIFYENKFFITKLSFLSLESLTPFFLSFFGKIWLIRFNKWIIFVLYVYSPKKIKIKQSSKSNTLNKKNYLSWKQNSNLKIFNLLKNKSISFLY